MVSSHYSPKPKPIHPLTHRRYADREGLRVYNGRIFELEEHLTRMVESAHMLMFKGIPSKEEIKQAIFQCLDANNMYNDTHIRLTLTRGNKVSSGMSPTNNQEGCCLIVLQLPFQLLAVLHISLHE